MMKTIKTLSIAAAISALGAFSANATTISVETFSVAVYDDYIASTTTSVTEDFESLGPQTQIVGPLVTAVGEFETIGGTGTGGSHIGDGTDLALRDEVNFGRDNTTVGGAFYLDSNDTLGFSWDADIGGDEFNSIAFSLSDVADVGAEMSIFLEGEVVPLATFVLQSHSVVDWIVISFSDFVTSATITFSNDILDDGFGIDDATIATVVPLPAAGLMLLFGLGGLAATRRRRKA